MQPTAMADVSYSTTMRALSFVLQYAEEYIEQAGWEFRRADEFDEGVLGERRPVLYCQATNCAVGGASISPQKKWLGVVQVLERDLLDRLRSHSFRERGA